MLRWRGNGQESELKNLLIETLKGEIKEEIFEFIKIVLKK